MKNKVFNITAILMLIFLCNSCKKEAGEGGNSSIRGKIWVQNYNATFTSLSNEYVGADVDVYIIYSTNTSYGNKIKSSPEGEFEFKYLREGDYTIYVYSKDKTLTNPSGKIAVKVGAKITQKEQVVDVGTITIYN